MIDSHSSIERRGIMIFIAIISCLHIFLGLFLMIGERDERIAPVKVSQNFLSQNQVTGF